ncbi:hypothetical protein H9P43_010112 [Blastocladiella emersonii ATCC 22665]|nr:hypothetical protein H9P43_010112 [Blastocladiella emersonii ATCC 22665]
MEMDARADLAALRLIDLSTLSDPVEFARLALSLELPEDFVGVGSGEIFSDSSLKGAGTEAVAAGAGVCTVDREEDFEWSFAVPAGNHSSFRSELWGVIAAASGVVDTAVKMLAPSARVKIRATCSLEWAVLRWIVEARNLKIALQWTPGHAGTKGNEVADGLANAGTQPGVAPLAINPAIRRLFDAPFTVMWRGQAINTDPRRFARGLNNARHSAVLATVTAAGVTRAPVDIPATAIVLRGGPRRVRGSESFSANATLSFQLKALAGQLPTCLRLHSWWPHRYPSEDCVECLALGHSIPDTQAHFFACPASLARVPEAAEAAFPYVAGALKTIDDDTHADPTLRRAAREMIMELLRDGRIERTAAGLVDSSLVGWFRRSYALGIPVNDDGSPLTVGAALTLFDPLHGSWIDARVAPRLGDWQVTEDPGFPPGPP